MAKKSLKLRKQIQKLKTQGNLCALKTGTEVEDMDFNEIQFLRDISSDIVPLIVKIGGPEARNDIRNCLKIGVDMILAPMVETVYALSNFVSSTKILLKELDTSCHLAINLESITAYNNLDTMIQSSAFASLQQVTIGRGDLSASMHLNLDDEEVINTSAKAVRKISNQGKITSVGGGLRINNIEQLLTQIPAMRFNTRHIVLKNDTKFKKNSKLILYNALKLEKEIYMVLVDKFTEKSQAYLRRIHILDERMGNIELINSISL